MNNQFLIDVFTIDELVDEIYNYLDAKSCVTLHLVINKKMTIKTLSKIFKHITKCNEYCRGNIICRYCDEFSSKKCTYCNDVYCSDHFTNSCSCMRLICDECVDDKCYKCPKIICNSCSFEFTCSKCRIMIELCETCYDKYAKKCYDCEEYICVDCLHEDGNDIICYKCKDGREFYEEIGIYKRI